MIYIIFKTNLKNYEETTFIITTNRLEDDQRAHKLRDSQSPTTTIAWGSNQFWRIISPI
jgi:hypothetical protein